MRAFFLFSSIVLGVGGAEAQSFDGNYVGKIICGVLSDLRRPLNVAFAMRVSGSEATYQREIVRPGADGGLISTGSFERGNGTISPAGEVNLRGKGEGAFVFEGEYRGQIKGSTVRLDGTQQWQIRSAPETRSCQIDLTRESG